MNYFPNSLIEILRRSVKFRMAQIFKTVHSRFQTSDELAVGNAIAFFQAGSATVRVTVEYLLHLMAHLPEVQRRVQAEIDEVTGRSREVSWDDSKELVYTMAVIAERHRYFTVAPLGVQRRFVA